MLPTLPHRIARLVFVVLAAGSIPGFDGAVISAFGRIRSVASIGSEKKPQVRLLLDDKQSRGPMWGM